MRAWVNYIRNVDESSGHRRLWAEGTHFGDWLALDVTISDPTSRKGGTPEDFIASAFYCYSAGLVARAASVLGKTELADEYGQLSAEVKAAIQKEYFTETGRLAVPTQTGYVLALFMNLVPDAHRKRVERDLIALLHKDKTHLRTGFVGTPYLCRVLSNIGANDLAYKLLLNEDYPSWLYAVNLGATTIWERWNSLNPDGTISSTGMNSLNHYAYGSIVEWMYRDMCGLNPSSGQAGHTGFRHALIAPKPHPSLKWAKVRYRSAAGLYESGWHLDDTGLMKIEITIPFNASATLVLPNAIENAILMNGRAISDDAHTGDTVKLTLSAGRYTFSNKLISVMDKEIPQSER